MLRSIIRYTGFGPGPSSLSEYSVWDYIRDSGFSDAELIAKFFKEHKPLFDLNGEKICALIDLALCEDRYEFAIRMLDAGARVPTHIVKYDLALTRLLLWYAPYFRETADAYRRPGETLVHYDGIGGAKRVPEGATPMVWDPHKGEYEELHAVIEKALALTDKAECDLIEKTAHDSQRMHELREGGGLAFDAADYAQALANFRMIADIYHEHLRIEERDVPFTGESPYTHNNFSRYRPVFLNFYRQKWLDALLDCYFIYEKGYLVDPEGLASLLFALATVTRELGLREDSEKYNNQLQQLNARALARVRGSAGVSMGELLASSGVFSATGLRHRDRALPKTEESAPVHDDEKRSLLSIN